MLGVVENSHATRARAAQRECLGLREAHVGQQVLEDSTENRAAPQVDLGLIDDQRMLSVRSKRRAVAVHDPRRSPVLEKASRLTHEPIDSEVPGPVGAVWGLCRPRSATTQKGPAALQARVSVRAPISTHEMQLEVAGVSPSAVSKVISRSAAVEADSLGVGLWKQTK